MANRRTSNDSDEADHERVPMLNSKRRLPNVHNKIEMSDGSGNEDSGEESFVNVIRARLTPLYIILMGIVTLLVAVIVVCLLLLLFNRSSKNDINLSKTANFSNREEFMRLYEEVIQHRMLPNLITNSMIPRLSPQQLQLARMAGILPLENSTYPFDGIPPSIPLFDGQKKGASGFQNKWNNEECQIQCDKQDVSIPPLLVISLDGFASEYLQRNLVPSLNAMAECGARAKYMFPSYPSKTFPNHYTIATGLYPESHGVVDNAVYDANLSPQMEDMKRTKVRGLYLGEPIWSLAVRQHRRMFCLFWPGCSFNITGYNPTIDLKYDKSMVYSKRVDLILEWLLLPPSERPSLIMAYFDQPDSVGHFHTDDRQVNLELIYLESVLHYLFTSLYKRGILDCTNIVILSDHGMQFLNERIYVDEVIDTTGMIVANGVIGRLHMVNSTSTVSSVLDQLQCHDTQHYSVYDRKRIPKRFHFAKSDRVGEIIFNGKPGTIFFPSRKEDYNVTSDHGYDYLTDSMKAIFFARGPNIKPHTVLEPFQNVELFNLFADLLRLDNDVPTNGTLGILDPIYTNMNIHRREDRTNGLKPASECTSSSKKNELKACFQSPECQAETEKANEWLNGCSSSISAAGIFYLDESSDSCFISLCSTSVLTTSSASYGKPVVFHERLSDTDARVRAGRATSRERPDHLNCFEFDAKYDANCDNWTTDFAEKRDPIFVWQSLASGPNNDIADLNRLQFLMYESFKNGPFAYLQNLTQSYVRKYKKVVSITGTIYDFNEDGLADDEDTFWNHQTAGANLEALPTHFFRVLMRCDDSLWHISGMNCRNAGATRLLAFILPNQKEELNCLMPDDYLLTNSARIRDIELLTNVYFFSDRLWFAENDALFWRLNITTALWTD